MESYVDLFLLASDHDFVAPENHALYIEEFTHLEYVIHWFCVHLELQNHYQRVIRK